MGAISKKKHGHSILGKTTWAYIARILENGLKDKTIVTSSFFTES